MATWRFSPGADDGDAAADGDYWLGMPVHSFAHVEYESTVTRQWRLIAVATRAYVMEQLRELSPAGRARSVFIPSMLILPDAEGPQLRDAIGQALDGTGPDMYSTSLEEIG
jgi:hypothetical protein